MTKIIDKLKQVVSGKSDEPAEKIAGPLKTGDGLLFDVIKQAKTNDSSIDIVFGKVRVGDLFIISHIRTYDKSADAYDYSHIYECYDEALEEFEFLSNIYKSFESREMKGRIQNNPKREAV